MLFLFLFLLELLFLFFLSRALTRTLSFFLYHLTRSKKFAIHFMAILFFPGTVIHELSHAIMAGVLGVPVGHMEFVPKIEGEKVKLGSVQIGHTDFLRRFLIGAAPFFIGTTILLGVLFFAAQSRQFDNIWIIIAIVYVVFEIGNTMFSSKKDMEGAIELLITVVFITLTLYFLGVRIPAINPENFFTQPVMQNMLQQGCLYLLVPIVLDLAVIGLFKFFKK